MMNTLKYSWLLVLLMALVVSCERDVDSDVMDEDSEDEVTEIVNEDNNVEVVESDDDYVWPDSEVDTIYLQETSIVTTSNNVSISGSVATITSPGNYAIVGTLNDGQIMVNSEEDSIVRLILSGADITCSSNAAIYVEEAYKTMLVLEEGTQNFVTDGASYTSDEEDANAAIFSKDYMIVYGTGELSVTGNYNDGITGKDGLLITSGIINVNAVDDGIRGKDYLLIKNGTITVDAGGDGLKSDNEEDATKGYISILDGSFEINADGDGIQAETDLFITTGEFDITAGGGSSSSIGEDESAKALKAGVDLEVYGGVISINSADDALHSDGTLSVFNGTLTLASGDDAIHAGTDLLFDDGYAEITTSYEGIESHEGDITVNAGEIYITSSDDGFNVAAGSDGSSGPGHKSTSSEYGLYFNGGYSVVNAGGDGLDSNGDIEITAGDIIVSGSTESNNSALDSDGTILANGGFLVATGTSNMAEAPSGSSSQYAVEITFRSTLSAGTLVHIETEAGANILTLSPEKSYQSVVVSSTLFEQGETYTVYYGGSASGEEKDGMYTSGDYSGGTKYNSFTISSTITSL